MFRSSTGHAFPLVLVAALAACSPEDTADDRCGGDYAFEDGGCVDTEGSGGGGGGGDTDAGGWLGAPCTCTGDGCEQLGMPVPTGGVIEGCDGVPTDWTGGDLACLRTNASGVGPPSWFANGFCALMAVQCEGSAAICDGGDVGDFDALVACPVGAALITGSAEISVMGQSATLTSKLCAPRCEGAGECREEEADPALDGAASQYTCHALQGVQFCYDPRNLGDDATAEGF